MSLISRSKLINQEDLLEKELSEEEKTFKQFINYYKKKSDKISDSRVIKESKKINDNLLFLLKKISYFENIEDTVIRTLIKELDDNISKDSLPITEDIRKNSESVKDFSKKLYELIEHENKLLEKGEYKDLEIVLEKEKELEKEFNITILSMLRDIKSLIKNTIENKPLISVIIPAYNEDRYIRTTLHSIKRQTYPNKEIIVVNNASIDLTSQKIKPYTYKELYLEQKGISFAKNNGAKRAKGEILIFVDADSILRKDLLEKVFEAYEKGFVAGIAKACFDKQKFMAKLYTHSQYITRTLLLKIPAAFLYIRKKEFFELGGFNVELKLAEDVDLASKIKEKYGRSSIKILDKTGIITSARRFEQKGYIKVLGQWARALFFPSKNIDYDDSVR